MNDKPEGLNYICLASCTWLIYQKFKIILIVALRSRLRFSGYKQVINSDEIRLINSLALQYAAVMPSSFCLFYFLSYSWCVLRGSYLNKPAAFYY